MQIEADGFDVLEVSSEGHLRRAIEFMSAKEGPTFVILSKSAEEYIQTAFDGEDDLVIECRRGGSSHHFKAVRSVGADERFSKGEVAEAFVSYWRGGPDPTWLTWQKITL